MLGHAMLKTGLAHGRIDSLISKNQSVSNMFLKIHTISSRPQVASKRQKRLSETDELATTVKT